MYFYLGIGGSFENYFSQGDLNMPDYLSKEEIRQWRSSLERITLEDYASRLGKSVQEEKKTKDLGDIVLKDSSNKVTGDEKYNPTMEKIHSIAQKSFVRENDFVKSKKEVGLAFGQKFSTSKSAEIETVAEFDEELNISFKKSLTAREQLVFDYFLANKNTVVYAKDLAKLLDLPRDYVYKYIKNLRNKIVEDSLQNSDNGGFILKV